MRERILPESKGEEPVKKGYVINDKDRVCVLADEDKRSPLQEKRIKTFSFRLQYKML